MLYYMEKVVITFGTFDLIHIGHINILRRSKKIFNRNNKLIVGISSDDFSYKKKNRHPIYNEKQRYEILKSIKYVDEVFIEKSFEKKREYILKYKADILIMGSDWKGKFDQFNDICKVIYLDRTPSISTTQLVEIIKNK
jgi:glycerol-3-phosphate cytidylyltransferase